MITLEELKYRLNYNPETGIFTWKTSKRSYLFVGKPTGTVNALGYVVIVIDKQMYLAHRLAWLYMTGEWPSENIDHINRRKHDNKWENLRLATPSQNEANSSSKNGISGIKGVFPHGSGWRARIKQNGKQHNLGTYRTRYEAEEAYNIAAKTLFGEFTNN